MIGEERIGRLSGRSTGSAFEDSLADDSARHQQPDFLFWHQCGRRPLRTHPRLILDEVMTPAGQATELHQARSRRSGARCLWGFATECCAQLTVRWRGSSSFPAGTRRSGRFGYPMGASVGLADSTCLERSCARSPSTSMVPPRSGVPSRAWLRAKRLSLGALVPTVLILPQEGSRTHLFLRGGKISS